MGRTGQIWRQFDFYLFGAVLLLIVFGILMLVLAFRLRGMRDTMRPASGAA